MEYLRNILGCFFLFTSFWDAIKYHFNATKIKKVQSAKGHSRTFINIAIGNDIVRIAYGISIMDWYIILSSILAIIFMVEYFWMMYLYYPYKYRNLLNFKKPNLFIYFWNSILPNKPSNRL